MFNLSNRRHKRRKRSHGKRRNSRHTSELTLNQLRNLYGGHGGLRHLLTTFYSTRRANLHKLFNECKQLIGANRDHRFSRIVLDVCSKRLFFPVRTGDNSGAKLPQQRFISGGYYTVARRYEF